MTIGTESDRPPGGFGSLYGLDSDGVRLRLERDGPNELPIRRPVRWWVLLAHQLTHFFAIMLWVAAGLAIIGGMPELGGAIVAVVVINALFAFAQERRADRMAARLRELLPMNVTVRRNGITTQIDASLLVLDDVVLLDPGDRISADLSVIEAHGLSVDSSTLTGESVPDAVGPGDTAFAGTFVVEGEAVAVVTATGSDTRLASIADLTRSRVRPRGPLAIEINHLVRTIATIAVAVGVIFFALSLLLGTDPSDGFLFAVGVTVALVPEGLLPTVTLSLALGAQRMAGENALVRRLESVETLGSTTIICTDKTGTLTRNEMEVVEIWTPVGSVALAGAGYGPFADVSGSPASLSAAGELCRFGVIASNGHVRKDDGHWIAVGDPMEAAIDSAHQRLGGSTPRPEIRKRFPFDPRRRRMSVITESIVCVKGAPESVIPACSGVPEGLASELEALTSRGLRVLAVATRDIEPGEDAQVLSIEGAERNLTLRGLIALEDPPRSEALAALTTCRDAGIAVIMVTGDHPATARAIATETGLALPGSPVVDGTRLPEDETELGAQIDVDGTVVARVSPEDKLRIAAALQKRGHVVAMTGDGVNDGPALQQADIGIAMGASGTDVAREASDLVLLDDNFATIITAIAQGRSTYTNIRRFLTYHLTDNVAELTPFVVWAISGGRIPLALTVLQILFLDIGTDLLPALGLGVEPPSRDVLVHPPHAGRLMNRRVLVRVFSVLGPAEAITEMAAFLATFLVIGWRPGDEFPGGSILLAASGAAFSAVVIGQLANALACRSATRFVWQVPLRSNPLMPIALAVEALALLAFLFVPAIADLLEQSPPTVIGWTIAVAAFPIVLLADTVHKYVRSVRAQATRRPDGGETPVSCADARTDRQ
jgi:magnesium-transporting ATPase (P-type)